MNAYDTACFEISKRFKKVKKSKKRGYEPDNRGDKEFGIWRKCSKAGMEEMENDKSILEQFFIDKPANLLDNRKDSINIVIRGGNLIEKRIYKIRKRDFKQSFCQQGTRPITRRSQE